MNNQPLVSVGLPVRNGANALEIALESIVNQTYNNLEIIVSDNNSTDETSEICRRYALRDKRIKYYRQNRNLNVIQNTRFVFNQLSGEYVVFAAHDDTRSRDYIEVLVKKMLEENYASIVFSDLLEFSELGGWRDKSKLIDYDFVSSYQDSFSKKLKMIYNLKRYTHLYGLIPRKLLSDYCWTEIDFDSDLVFLFYLSCRGNFVKANNTKFFYYRPIVGKLHRERAMNGFFHELKYFRNFRLCLEMTKVGCLAEKQEGRNRIFIFSFFVSLYYLSCWRIKKYFSIKAIGGVVHHLTITMSKNLIKKMLKFFIPSSSRWLPRCYYASKYLDLKSLPANARLLDAGCGQGRMLMQFERRDIEIVGIDDCSETISIATQNMSLFAKNNKIRLLTADLTKLPFTDNYFDAIISLDVIEFIEDDEAAFRELARVLKPGGKLIVSVLHKNLEFEDDNLSFEQRLLRKITPRRLLTENQPYNGRNWLVANAQDKFQQDGRRRNYTLEDILQKTEAILDLTRFQFMIKRFFRLAMDITYSIKGLEHLRPISFPIALALDAVFCRKSQGYAIILELRKKT